MAVLRVLAVLLVALVVGCAGPPPPPGTVPPSHLEGWRADDHGAALLAFRQSCPKLLARPPSGPLGGVAGAGDTQVWQRACLEAEAVPLEGARSFFERRFVAVSQLPRSGGPGLFTGYFEPLLHGSRSPTPRFRYPLHRAPADLDRRRGHALLARAAIDRGALGREGLELVWVDDPIAKFFLQIQGSGQVALPDGSRIRVGYAGQNGHRYHPIGRDLIDAGYVPRELMSMQAIDGWLRTAPEPAAFALMHRNPSYVFFRELGPVATTPGPLGAMEVPLTPGRSLAVDPDHTPYGALVWVETRVPQPSGPVTLQRLMVAQDTGGAIRGPVRGDVFWGTGPEAEYAAGHMKEPGRLWVLVPR